MKPFAWAIALICTLVALTGTATAGTIPPPELKPGVFVYTIPEGFDPPAIGRSGIDEIQRSVSQLHYPYYVVIADRISANSEADVANAIDGLAEDWQRLYPNTFKVGTSQIFLLSYNPRQYRFLAGALFKAELGFEREAHTPYTSIFEKYAKGTPKDPQSGMLKMASAVDDYLFDQMDPRRIAARKEAQRLAEEAKRLQTARGNLDGEIMRLTNLLRKDDRILPPDVDAYRQTLEHANTIRYGNDPAAMDREATAIKPSVDVLETFVKERRAEAWTRAIKTSLQRLAIIGLLAALFILIMRRVSKLKALRRTFQDAAKEWKDKINNASGQYLKFYGERDDVVGLSKATGETAERFRAVTEEIDAIFAAVNAMSEHLDACALLAKRGWFFSLAPLLRAIKDLEGGFEFDTGTLNEADLFEPERRIISVDPKNFAQELERRFTASIKGWKELKDAARGRLQIAEEALPSANLDALFVLTDEYDIPRRWLQDHPLYGDDESDRSFYASLNDIRLNDPLTYAQRIKDVRELETNIAQRLDRLVVAVQLVRDKRLATLPNLPVTIVDPGDNPAITLEEARREEAKLAGRLASSDRVEDIEEQARKTHDLYQKCAEQAATITSAFKGASAAIQAAKRLGEEAAKIRITAEAARAPAEKVHAQCRARSFIDSGDRFAGHGRMTVEKAERQLQANSHLSAHRGADEASQAYRDAKRKYEEALKHCLALDEQRQEYERKLATMAERRNSAERKIRAYGHSARLGDFREPSIDHGLVDYAVLHAALIAQERAWADAELRARRAHEEEERRQRAAEERRRRQREEEEAAERRRRSSYSSSSSSGGSWGGMSSSSGGSWGGGSSSSGGGW